VILYTGLSLVDLAVTLVLVILVISIMTLIAFLQSMSVMKPSCS
jgi:hypothetical protein